ncbi:hypothetical protein GPDM_12447 [Planococcus donghaensis MPA1U2]|uniref:Uncharacterized protein n=1 Tax=Planococcus donghaensis MPA1U2 TaxID=933115 RepID=E7RJ26_9BACL|nr:hypothetical protein [Planococcus donghaensis]EGA89036.1 hypothetical protein GPDM_12447 [Planococcus donghaensis MPA1U2]
MTMEYLLIAASIFLLLLNLLLMLTVKSKRNDEGSDGVYESMANFVTQLEEENNELYDKLTTYIKNSEMQLSERIKQLEKREVSTFLEKAMPYETSIEIEKIMQLSKQGFSPKQIAKVLQIDYGKVDLIVHMNSMKRSNSKGNGVL